MRDVDVTPRFYLQPGQTILKDWAGKEYIGTATPAALNQQKEIEAASRLGTTRPLHDSASFSDYLRSGEKRTITGLMRYCTKHQVSPQKTIALELEARSAGVLRRDEDATTGAPLQRQAQPFTQPKQYHQPSRSEDEEEVDDTEEGR